MKDYYKILELTPDATKVEIKDAYRKLAKKYHPDKNENDLVLAELLKDINEAKHTLNDEVKKAEYDRLLFNFKLAKLFNENVKEAKRSIKASPHHPHRSSFKFKGLWIAGALTTVILGMNFFWTGSENELSATVNNKIHLAAKKATSSITAQPAFAKAVIHVETPNILKIHEQLPGEIDTSRIEIAKTKGPSITEEIKKVAVPTSMELSMQAMEDILERIKAEKKRSNNAFDCIQIRKTNASNVANAFKLADFFSSKGFSISGREIIYTQSKGIAIDASSSCIKVTIGSL